MCLRVLPSRVGVDGAWVRINQHHGERPACPATPSPGNSLNIHTPDHYSHGPFQLFILDGVVKRLNQGGERGGREELRCSQRNPCVSPAMWLWRGSTFALMGKVGA